MSLIEKLSEFMSPYYVLTGNIKEKSKTVNNYGISVCLYQLEANSVQNGLKNANGARAIMQFNYINQAPLQINKQLTVEAKPRNLTMQAEKNQTDGELAQLGR